MGFGRRCLKLIFMKKKKVKALALFSGGLDSILAIKLILEQGVRVVGIKFTSPFLTGSESDYDAAKAAKELGIPLITEELGEDYLGVIRKPKYGYGKNLNPCLDCRIFILKRAKEIAKKIKADFIFTGEVLGERPMSQHMRAFKIIEKEAGLEGKILRPLSAKLLPETGAERKGFVDRKKLLAIEGRSRKLQIELAKKYKLKYPQPGGGCSLTYKGFSEKVRDLFKHQKRVSMEDIELLRIGRHLRDGKNKIIVGRNEEENEKLAGMKEKGDYFFEVPRVGSPIAILKGPKTKRAIEIAGKLTAYYSDSKGDKVKVRYGVKKLDKEIVIKKINAEEIDKFRISKN